jgi:chitinase
MAFVLANGCNPVWDGEGGLTGGVHASYIQQIKAAGGDIVPSVGGYSGNKLGPNCTTTAALAGAYQKIIDAFGLKAIDIDIENTDEFENYVVADRIVGALKIVKQKNPGVKTILTFGTTPTGPNTHGIRLINQARAMGADVDVFAQMPFDFSGGADMYASTVGASEGLKNQLKSTFGWTDAQAYSHMGISGMNGLSDQQELTSTDTWTRIRDYARNNNFARFTFWAVNRDRGCAGGGVVSDCSGIAQADWAFTKVTAGF